MLLIFDRGSLIARMSPVADFMVLHDAAYFDRGSPMARMSPVADFMVLNVVLR